MELYLLLIGKTGTGKSGTGNSILGCPAFISEASVNSVTFNSKRELSEMDDGRILHVVDTPGLVDTKLTEEGGQSMFKRAITEAISMSPKGYDALLYTLRYGARFTKEDMDVLHVLKKIFGDNFIEKHAVVVMSNGDNFKENEGEEMEFHEWCQEQSGHFKEIYEAVDGRVVLFDNTKRCSEEEKSEQRKILVDMVDTLRSSGCRYTNEVFEEAQRHYEKLMNEEKEKFLDENIRDETSKILTQLEKVEERDGIDIQGKMKTLDKLELRLPELQGRMSEGKSCQEFLSETRIIVREMLDKVKRNKKYLTLRKEIEEQENSNASMKSKQFQEKIAQLETAKKDEFKQRQRLRKSFNHCRDVSNTRLHMCIFQKLNKLHQGST